ncbi:hypothetical protein [Marinobacter sp. C2H3]|uniref:hypothetical protein n=1 Tax=Marinobacter sp. C2H3 TaxID=3119003 RepID=UPI00300E72B1
MPFRSVSTHRPRALKPGALAAALGLSALLLSGCANTPSDPTEMADSSAALGYEKPEWKTPFWEQKGESAPSTAAVAAPPKAASSAKPVPAPTYTSGSAPGGPTPWLIRRVPTEDGRVLISAGRAAGVAVGDELTVHAPGHLLRTPDGQPLAWQAGPLKGRVRVMDLVGDNLAVVGTVEGDAPTVSDELLLSR